MVVGSGMIASALSCYKAEEGVLIFASGVSNSRETSETAFQRERALLETNLKQRRDTLFVYFSTTSIHDPDLVSSPYVLHKLAMERLVRFTANRYLIFRCSEVVGRGGNRANVVNFFHSRISNDESFDLWVNASRRLIDVEDVVASVTEVIDVGAPAQGTILLTVDQLTHVEDIVAALEQTTGKKANYRRVAKGNCSNINQRADIDEAKVISVRENYAAHLISKYYGGTS